jgi:7-cyano-7-deazaguanine synthase
MTSLRPAVVLLSGGMDSAVSAAIARADGFAVHALSFRYGQRHAVELEAAARVAHALAVTNHLVVGVDLSAFGGSALTDDIAVPTGRSASEIGHAVPPTYVPARNTVFLSLALAWAEVLGSLDIFIGANAVDYSGYPDCRPEYLAAFERLAALATVAGAERGERFTIHAPLLTLSKREIVERGVALGVDFSLTRTCYAPDGRGRACGRCDACLLRLKGFAEAGTTDPIPYIA